MKKVFHDWKPVVEHFFVDFLKWTETNQVSNNQNNTGND